MCYLGGVSCQLCGGSCCRLVNSVIDALVEEGELDPNAEVYIILCIFSVLVFFVTQNQRQAVISLIYRLHNLKVIADRVGKQVCYSFKF